MWYWRHWVGVQLLPALPAPFFLSQLWSSHQALYLLTSLCVLSWICFFLMEMVSWICSMSLELVIDAGWPHPWGSRVVFQWGRSSSTTAGNPVSSATAHILPSLH